MGTMAIRLLRVIIAVALAGSVVAQATLVASVWKDVAAGTRIALAVIGVLGIVCLQVIGVCVWRLLALVRRGTLFSRRSFAYVDTVIGAIASGSVLVLAVAVVARFANRGTPGDAVAPGLVGFVCGMALVVAGVALVVYVLRLLLVQAMALDSRSRRLQAELDEVV